MGGGFNAAVMNGDKNLWGDPLHLLRAGKRTLRRHRLRGVRRRRRPGHQLHLRPGPGADEGGALHHLRQTAAGGDEHRRPRLDQPGPQRPCRARRRDVGRRRRLGHDLRPQRPGSRRLLPDLPAAPPRPRRRPSSTFRTASSPRTPSKPCGCPKPEFMKEFIGDPKEKLINLMDPANPVMSGVVQNQDSYMKGKIAQRWYYDRVEPALEECLRGVLPQDRPQVRLRRSLPLRGCRVHPRRHGLLHGNGQGDGRLPAQQGHRGRVLDGVRVPALPRPGRSSRP